VAAQRETFGGKVYTFGTLPATKSIPIALEIGPIMADAAAEVGGMAMQAAEADRAAVVMAKATGAMLRRLSAADWTDRNGQPHIGLLSMMGIMFEHVEVIENGKAHPVTVDSFTGKVSVAKDVFTHALKVNFADFFPASPSVSSPGEPKGA
jgi:hypothetical protein